MHISSFGVSFKGACSSEELAAMLCGLQVHRMGVCPTLSITQDLLLTCISCKVGWFCVFNVEIKSDICFQRTSLELAKSKIEGSPK